MTGDLTILKTVRELTSQFLNTNNQDLIHQAIQELEEFKQGHIFADLSPEDRSRVHTVLAIQYYTLYSIENKPYLLEEGHRSVDEAVAEIDSEIDDYVIVINTIAIGIRSSPVTSKLKEVVEKCIEIQNSIYEMNRKTNGIESAGTLTNLGNSYRSLFEITQIIQHLEKAIDYHRQALSKCEKDQDLLPRVQSNLGNALRQMFTVTKDLAYLEEAVDLHRSAVENSKESADQNDGIFEFTYGMSLLTLFSETNNIDDANSAVKFLSSSTEKSEKGSWQRIDRLLDLATALNRRFALSRNRQDLDAAIRIFEQIGDSLDESNERVPGILAESSIAYRLKYEFEGDVTALDRAVSSLERYSSIADVDPHTIASNLADLGILYGVKYGINHDFSLLIKAKSTFEKVLDNDLGDDPLVPRTYFNLANVLASIFTRSGDKDFLEQAISSRKKSIELTDEGSDELAARLAGLSQNLFNLYQITNDPAVLDEAFEYIEKAITHPTPTELDLVEILHFRARLSSFRYHLHKKEKDKKQCYSDLQRAIKIATGKSFWKSLLAAKALAYEAFSHLDWDIASDAFNLALDSADVLFERQVSRENKEYWRMETFHLYHYAAFAFAKDNRFEDAILAIERGRAKFLFEQLRIHHPDIQRLAAHEKDLSDELIGLLEEINELSQVEVDNSFSPIPHTVSIDLHARREKLSQLVDRIRSLEGFDNFLEPTNSEEIYIIAEEHPLVYTSVTTEGCVVIIVFNQRRLEVLWFDDFDIISITKKLGWITQSFYPFFGAAIDHMCEWLGNSIVGKLHEEINNLGINKVTIVAQGILGILPLHSAWVADPSTGIRRYILDDITISYTPSGSTLGKLVRSKNKGMDSIIAIEDPTQTLPNAPLEIVGILKLFADKALLGGVKATKEKVLKCLDSADIIHFSCHGTSDAINPLENSLIMANNEALTLADILKVTFNQTRLVVLSACETGLIGRNLPDEVIGFPIGFIQKGVLGVVSSIWPVDDESTSLLMQDLYKNMITKNMEPTDALRCAQLALRDGQLSTTDFSHPFYWGSFFMTGI